MGFGVCLCGGPPGSFVTAKCQQDSVVGDAALAWPGHGEGRGREGDK